MFSSGSSGSSASACCPLLSTEKAVEGAEEETREAEAEWLSGEYRARSEAPPASLSVDDIAEGVGEATREATREAGALSAKLFSAADESSKAPASLSTIRSQYTHKREQRSKRGRRKEE
jgi:hypothetical protein